MAEKYKIDMSRLDEAETAEWNRLIAKAKVDPEAAAEEMEDEKPDVPAETKSTEKAEVETMEDTKKSAPATEPEVPQFVKDAIAKSEEFIEKSEKKEMADIAKKYAVLVESVEDLADQLYNLKKSNPDLYTNCISLLDKQAAMVEKSGLFAEVGKSAGAYSTSGGAEAKAEAKAAEIMKADPNMTHTAALAKAYMDPTIMAEYDKEYFGR